MKPLLSQQERTHLLLRELALSALLHLEFHQLDKGRRLSLVDKNSLFRLWLKKQATSQRYKLLKKKIKVLIQHSKGNSYDLEKMFLELINYSETVSLTQLEEYLLLVRSIEKDIGLTVLLSSPHDVDLGYGEGKQFICVLATDLNRHFSDEGDMLAPITFLVRSSVYERSAVLANVYKFGQFSHTVLYEDDDFLRFELKS
ncbi:hypothetical protein BIY22_15015 [Vibrio panuliri]|uniref:DUF2913 domain-containing protein n=1 Tax=Vibrio panuliri TaxID=1381081 RepID=A0A1Q9HP54_9VIBR|nr:DUF2913 family protein [Vibrio panuliri]OLQ92635.1 hypothetical protein BIY22_15015 [Vibrio panuliri]